MIYFKLSIFSTQKQNQKIVVPRIFRICSTGSAFFIQLILSSGLHKRAINDTSRSLLVIQQFHEKQSTHYIELQSNTPIEYSWIIAYDAAHRYILVNENTTETTGIGCIKNILTKKLCLRVLPSTNWVFRGFWIWLKVWHLELSYTETPLSFQNVYGTDWTSKIVCLLTMNALYLVGL